MMWKKINHCDPHETCVVCGHNGDHLEIFRQYKGIKPFGKQYVQHCGECGCASVFYMDELRGKYFGQVFMLVDLEVFEEMRQMEKPKVNSREEEGKILDNMMRLSKKDLDLLKRFAKGEVSALIGIVEELLAMEKHYRFNRNEIQAIVNYLRSNQEYI